jgi:hypothetical protein
LEPQHLAGVWANWARVSQTIHEFTLDFVRLDPTINKGIVVARVSVSPLFVTQLIDALRQEWSNMSEERFPRRFMVANKMNPTIVKKLEPEPLRHVGTTTDEKPPSGDAQRTVGEVLAAELRRIRSTPRAERPR